METKTALVLALVISLAVLVVELSGGFAFQSSALVADALHIMTDILAISFSLFALVISTRPPSGGSTYGYHRIEVVASLVNGVSLIGVVAVIFITAYQRFVSPVPINAEGTILFAAGALVLNIISSSILARSQAYLTKGEKDLNVSSTQFHIIGDALSSLAVIVGAAIVYVTGYRVIDPIVAVIIGFIVLKSALEITLQGGAIILERSPIKNMQELEQRLLTVRGVSDIHDFHIWRICSHITLASMHACLEPSSRDHSVHIRSELEQRLGESGVQHVTIQLEDKCCVPRHGHE